MRHARRAADRSPRHAQRVAGGLPDQDTESPVVLLAVQRTPTVAALYGSLVTGSTPLEALDRVRAVLPSANPRRSFVRELERMSLS